MADRRNTKKESVQILAELQDIWKKYDEIYSSLTAEDWDKKYGKEWTFADQPYHLAFFDRMVAKAIREGEKGSDKFLIKDMAQINKWNESEFKKRPVKYTAKDSLKDFQKSHQMLIDAVEKQKSMDGRVWMPLFFGWTAAIDALNASLVHHVGEYIELALRRNKPIKVLPSSMKRRAQFMLMFMSLSVNTEEAAKRDFVMEWNFTGGAKSSWTVEIKNGKGKLIEGKAKNPDLAMTLSLETFEKMLRKMKNPMLMMVTGEIKVKGFSKMPVFAKLFPQP